MLSHEFSESYRNIYSPWVKDFFNLDKCMGYCPVFGQSAWWDSYSVPPLLAVTMLSSMRSTHIVGVALSLECFAHCQKSDVALREDKYITVSQQKKYI